MDYNNKKHRLKPNKNVWILFLTSIFCNGKTLFTPNMWMLSVVDAFQCRNFKEMAAN